MDSPNPSTKGKSDGEGGWLDSFGKAYRDAAPYLALGIQLAATVVLLFFFGRWADEQFSTRPWMMLIGLFVGTVAGMINFVRTINQLGKRHQDRGQ
jgi:F0F1-type ATP synthase assembly protein I